MTDQKKASILEEICAQRLIDVMQIKVYTFGALGYLVFSIDMVLCEKALTLLLERHTFECS